MIRLIVQVVHALPSGEIGGKSHFTFDIDNEKLQEMLALKGYSTASLIGAEVLNDYYRQAVIAAATGEKPKENAV